MQSLIEDKIYQEGEEKYGVAPEQITELVELFRKEFDSEPTEFSELLGVLL